MTIHLKRMFGPVYLGLLALTFVACFEDSPPGIASGLSSNVAGGPPDQVLGDPRTLGPIEIDYPREPPLYETDDAALVEAIKASDGYVFVGLKAASTNKLPDRPKTGIATRRKVVMPGVSADVLAETPRTARGSIKRTRIVLRRAIGSSCHIKCGDPRGSSGLRSAQPRSGADRVAGAPPRGSGWPRPVHARPRTQSPHHLQSRARSQTVL